MIFGTTILTNTPLTRDCAFVLNETRTVYIHILQSHVSHPVTDLQTGTGAWLDALINSVSLHDPALPTQLSDRIFFLQRIRKQLDDIIVVCAPKWLCFDSQTTFLSSSY